MADCISRRRVCCTGSRPDEQRKIIRRSEGLRSPRLLIRNLLRGQIQLRHAVGDRRHITVISVGEHHDRQAIVHEPHEVRCKPRQSSAVPDSPASTVRLDVPAQTVGRSRSVSQPNRGPHLPARGVAENPVGVEQSIPFRQVQHRRQKRAACAERAPLVRFAPIVVASVAERPVRNPRGRIRGPRRRRRSARRRTGAAS